MIETQISRKSGRDFQLAVRSWPGLSPHSWLAGGQPSRACLQPADWEKIANLRLGGVRSKKITIGVRYILVKKQGRTISCVVL